MLGLLNVFLNQIWYFQIFHNMFNHLWSFFFRIVLRELMGIWLVPPCSLRSYSHFVPANTRDVRITHQWLLPSLDYCWTLSNYSLQLLCCFDFRISMLQLFTITTLLFRNPACRLEIIILCLVLWLHGVEFRVPVLKFSLLCKVLRE